jgi:outer membrane protein assembly factor BamB
LSLWNFTTGGNVTSSPAIANGVVYIGSADNQVYALDSSKGKLLWNYTVGEVSSSPIVANGLVFVGSNDGKFYALEAMTGNCVWSYATGGMVVSSPAIANNIVYVGSYDHMLYAFGSLSSQQTNSSSFTFFISLILVTIAFSSAAVLATVFYKKKHKSDLESTQN